VRWAYVNTCGSAWELTVWPNVGRILSRGLIGPQRGAVYAMDMRVIVGWNSKGSNTGFKIKVKNSAGVESHRQGIGKDWHA